MLCLPPQGATDLVDLNYPTLTAVQAGLGPKFAEFQSTGSVTLTTEQLFQMLQNAFDSGVSAAVEQHHNDEKVMRSEEKLEGHLHMPSDAEKTGMDIERSDPRDARSFRLQEAVQQKDQELEAQKRIVMAYEARLKAQDVEMTKLRGKRAAYIVAEFGNRMFR